jgi:signal transduction histidine kinase
MKHRNGDSLISEPGRLHQLLLFSLFAVLACWVSTALAEPPQEAIQITHAQYIVSDAAALPDNASAWKTVTLPHRSPKPDGDKLVHYWYRTSFASAETAAPVWLYFPKLRSGGAIFINGMLAAEIRSADRLYQVRWFRPHRVFVPPSFLKTGQNDIAVRFAIREPLTSFGEFWIGPEQALQKDFEQRRFWESTSTDMASGLCLLFGAFIVIFWWRRKQERLYGIFGACVLFWGLRTWIFQMPEVPMDYWVLWRFFYYLTTAGFITWITIFLLEFSGAKQAKLNRFLVCSWLGGSFGFLLFGATLRPVMDTYWIMSFLPFTVYAVIRLGIFAQRQRTLSGMAMVFAIVFALGLSLHDYAVQHGLFHLQEFYLLHLGIPAFLLVMACVLQERFIDSLQQAESASEQLAQRIGERERQLGASHEQLRRLERAQSAAEERQRIMQDMHDGVGSQLLSTLVVARRGTVSQNDMVTLLQECLDDMRLAIDSLASADPDFLSALGNFRFRMEARFTAMGLPLHWRNHAMPDTIDIAPHAVLQVLRILQEALTNVLKHARASKVEVDIAFFEASLRMQITDDGIGFPIDEKSNGRGIGNMRMRARKLDAVFDIESTSSGTTIHLDIPFMPPGSPAWQL